VKTNLQPPQNIDEFFPWLKTESEKFWETIEISKGIYGFQIQAGTKWLPGLTDEQITAYEKEMGFAFPEIYKAFLRTMNGTDKQTINVMGNSGEPHGYGLGFYSYPRDIAVVKDMIGWICEEFKFTSNDLDIKDIPHIMPIVSHRFLVIDHYETNPVLSMYGNDVVPYADSLDHFLYYDIFSDFLDTKQQRNLGEMKIKFWLE